jgi:hypothetical protein
MSPFKLLAIAALTATGAVDPTEARKLVAGELGLDEEFTRARAMKRHVIARFMKETGRAMPAWATEFWPCLSPMQLQRESMAIDPANEG